MWLERYIESRLLTGNTGFATEEEFFPRRKFTAISRVKAIRIQCIFAISRRQMLLRAIWSLKSA